MKTSNFFYIFTLPPPFKISFKMDLYIQTQCIKGGSEENTQKIDYGSQTLVNGLGQTENKLLNSAQRMLKRSLAWLRLTLFSIFQPTQPPGKVSKRAKTAKKENKSFFCVDLTSTPKNSLLNQNIIKITPKFSWRKITSQM